MYLYCKQGINKSESNFLDIVVHILSIIRFSVITSVQSEWKT